MNKKTVISLLIKTIKPMKTYEKLLNLSKPKTIFLKKTFTYSGSGAVYPKK